MFNWLKQIVSKNQEEEKPSNKLDVVLKELDFSISVIKTQFNKISDQDSDILEKLQEYNQNYGEKLKNAKRAYSNKKESEAESIYKESEIIKQQIDHYKRISEEIQETKRKLSAQENQFLLSRDKLLSKKVMGEAYVDASQLNAELSEKLMFLDESDELSKFDELIIEADSKSQAIKEIQGGESTFDNYIQDTPSALDDLQSIVEKEKEQKMQASQRNQQVLIEQAFGKTPVSTDISQKEKQISLLNQLKENDMLVEKEDKIDKFFNPSESATSKNVNSKEDIGTKEEKVKNFFGKGAKVNSKSTS
jgi:hypothetical protein